MADGRIPLSHAGGTATASARTGERHVKRAAARVPYQCLIGGPDDSKAPRTRVVTDGAANWAERK